MKKILFSLMTIALVAVMAVGGAFAYFSDTEESTGNVFTAGTLDLGLANTVGTSPRGSVEGTWVTPANWAPGETAVDTLFVNNEGNIAASTVTVDFTHTPITDGTPQTVDLPWDSTLDGSIIATTVTWGGIAVGALQGLTLAELVELDPYDLGALGADTEVALHIVWTLDADADNGVQGDSVTVTLSFEASQ